MAYYGKKYRIFTIGAAVMLAPVMIMSAAQLLPTAEEFIYGAADMSARLVSGGGKPLQEEDISADGKENAASETSVTPPAVRIDDSMMISRGELIRPSSENEEAAVTDEETADEPYPADSGERDGRIENLTYGKMTGDSYIDLEKGGQVRNVTSLSNDVIAEECTKPFEFKIERNGKPQVLIMHTHETESYEPYERDYYDADFTCRTTDDSMNMAAVGDAIAKKLEEAGIGVIHDVTKHDYPSYNGSYDRSRETVTGILEENPSISVVLDIHRDAIEREDGTRIAPVARIGGRNAAQVMIICGCDDGTMDMPMYMHNLRFASALQQQLETDHKGLTRPVLFDYRKYNQDLTTGSVLIEVGGHGNSMDQAVYTGELIGESLVNMFT